jgi:hypothetical protein
MHAPPVEGNFSDESGRAIKPTVVADYNTYMGFVDKSERMVNSYGIARRTWKWTQKIFFHLTDMTILHVFLIQKSCGGKMTHKNFREVLVRKLIIHSHEENVTASGISRGRPSPFPSQLRRLEVKHQTTGLPKESKGGVPCVPCRSKHGASCISARSVTLVCV